jgi:hypothetical protein
MNAEQAQALAQSIEADGQDYHATIGQTFGGEHYVEVYDPQGYAMKMHADWHWTIMARPFFQREAEGRAHVA